MLDLNVCEVVGTPNENVTHWGISRRERSGGRESWTRLDHPRDDGVRIREWPLETLTPALVRAQWGAGTFKVHWFALDPENEEPERRRVSGGHGPFFTLDPEPVEPVAVPTLPAPPSLSSSVGQDPMTAALAFAQHLMALADSRTTSTIEAVARMAGTNRGGDDHGLAAQVAALQAEMRASEERRRIEETHRDALAARDREIAEIRRKLEEAEREREEPAAPMFQPGESIWESLGYGILNAAAANPAAAGAVLAPLLGKLLPGASGAQPDAPAAGPPLPARTGAPVAARPGPGPGQTAVGFPDQPARRPVRIVDAPPPAATPSQPPPPKPA